MAVAQAIASFTKAGYDVSLPLTESAPYDLIVDTGLGLKRVQVRYTSSHQVDLRRIHSNSQGYVVKRTRPNAYDWLYVLNHMGEEFLLPECLHSRRAWNTDRRFLLVVQREGGVTERTKVAVLKTAGGQPPVGSNPTPSAG
jgi:PD-(D/E)XK nuclease superfamily protein